jgi:hypothetical protein
MNKPILLLAFALCACSTVQRHAYVANHVADYVYDKPLEEVWPSVRQVLSDDGFSLQESPGEWVAITDWQTGNAGSQVAGFWTRKMVVGSRVDSRHCLLRAYMAVRYANDAVSSAQEIGNGYWIDHSYGPQLPGVRLDAANMGGAEDMDPAGGLNDSLSRLVQPYGTLGAISAAHAKMSHRDLPLEQRIIRQVHQEDALSEEPNVGPDPLVAARECGDAILGADELLRPGSTTLLGEFPGTREIPQFAVKLACQAAARGSSVFLAVELPVEQQSAIDAYLSNQAAPADVERLTSQEFWRRPYQDGRSSEAMLGLLAEVKRLRAVGLHIDVRALEERGVSGDVKDSLMAERLLAPLMTNSSAVVVALIGNVHARAAQGFSWDPTYRPTGWRLAQTGHRVVALDAAFANGTMWLCSVSDRLDCGEHPAKGQAAGSQTLVKVWGQRSRDGFDGFFYVGPVSASPPAVAHR